MADPSIPPPPWADTEPTDKLPPPRDHLRGQLTMRIKDAHAQRESEYEGFRQMMLAADETYDQAVTQAWAQYDADMAKAGHVDGSRK